jgi:protein SCO1/2
VRRLVALLLLVVAASSCRDDKTITAGSGWTEYPPLTTGGAPAAAATPPVLSTLPAFALTNEAGKPFGSAELAGKPWVANFIFTRCPTVCPIFTAKMADVQKRTDAKTHLVSFSVDPGHDTPAVLAEYAKKNGADPERWTFLTGDPEAIRAAVVEGLKVAAQPIGKDDDLASVFHGSHFVLVDAQNRIRGYYDSADADATDRLLRDLQRL